MLSEFSFPAGFYPFHFMHRLFLGVIQLSVAAQQTTTNTVEWNIPVADYHYLSQSWDLTPLS